MYYRGVKRPQIFLKMLYYENAPKKERKNYYVVNKFGWEGLSNRQSQLGGSEPPLRTRGTSYTKKEFSLNFIR